MTQENEKLLLQDLCGRLPYGVKVYNEPYTFNLDNFKVSSTINETIIEIIKEGWKPYLRPKSSMTEEEEKEYRKTQITKWIKSVDCTYRGYYDHRDTLKTFDWLNANHFDYRGLIEKGLAIEVTEDNNPYKSHE